MGFKRPIRYKGVLFIATNNIERMDPAFARRLIFKVRLDRPDPATRLELWRFWQQRLGASDHTIGRLASSFELTGGEIRNVAARAIVREECSLEELSRSCEQELGVRTGREPRKLGI